MVGAHLHGCRIVGAGVHRLFLGDALGGSHAGGRVFLLAAAAGDVDGNGVLARTSVVAGDGLWRGDSGGGVPHRARVNLECGDLSPLCAPGLYTLQKDKAATSRRTPNERAYTEHMSNAMHVGVIGTGYVGLVTATCLAEAGHHLTCVDNDPRKIQMLREGRVPIYEPGLEDMVARNVAAGRMRFSESTAEAAQENELLFIAVGTPGREEGTAD